ncbi:AAA domain-containing protein [Mycoplasmatota bacterium zrk1]
MNINDHKIYDELIEYRNWLREDESNGTVCSDEAVKEIVKNKPRFVDEFSSLYGVGSVFTHKYAEGFLEKLNKLLERDKDVFVLEKKEIKLLDTLESRLININKRNTNLFVGEIRRKRNFDLVNNGFSKILEQLFFQGNKRVFELYKSSKSENQQDMTLYKSLSILFRELDRDVKETGLYDLYIAYPFVEGKSIFNDFDFNAPLSFFPVRMVKEGLRITITKDTSREIIINESLILANMKLNTKQHQEIQDVEVDISNITYTEYIAYLANIYKTYGLEFSQLKDTNHQSLGEVNVDKFKTGFKLKKYMILGKFSNFSNLIQRDINYIKMENKLNSNLYDLLFDRRAPNKLGNEVNKELNINQIRNLDYSQRNVIDKLNKVDSVVIEGPPGTGKSQAIVSIISNEILNNGNCLMIAEKKAAIDVIYSRLGKVRNYSMIIDTSSNKLAFYEQLHDIFTLKTSDESHVNNTKSIELSMKDNLNKIKLLEEKINAKCLNGVTYNDLLKKYPKYDLSEKVARTKYFKVKRLYNKYFKRTKFALISESLKRIMSEETKKLIRHYQEHTKEYSTFKYVKDDLLYEDIHYFNQIVSDYISEKNDLEDLPKLKKFLTNNINSIKLSFRLRKYFRGYFKINKLIRKLNQLSILNDYIVESYTKTIKAKKVYDELSTREKRVWHYLNNNELDLELNYKETITIIANILINKFSKENSKTLKTIEKYNKSIDFIRNGFSKIEINNMNILEKILKINISRLVNYKQYSKMMKILKAKRKPSVGKFVRKYSYELFNSIKLWIVTPEVVSSILPLYKDLFSLCIFDEASQMYVEKSIPALYRSKKTVVSGDSHQLKPSSLGFGRVEGLKDPDDYLLDDMQIQDQDSLLDIANMKYERTYLNYHYRANYQEIINFSNYAFYHGKLIVPPYKYYDINNPPIEVLSVENGIWENKHNIEEAKAVVMKLYEVLKKKEKSTTVGIITFNSPQRDLIEELIEDFTRNNQEFRILYEQEFYRGNTEQSEYIFVKNIENVQGDERDIIIISIGYGKNIDGKMIRQFGWLNQLNGENRLNVAITRAKYKVYVFLSFDPYNFSVGDLDSVGPKLLIEYLKYAVSVSNSDKLEQKRILANLDREIVKSKTPNSDFYKDFKETCSKYNLSVINLDFVIDGTIDLLVRDKETQAQAGIIINDSYNGNIIRDNYFKGEYLRTRDISVYDIWLKNWWDNKANEINKIKKMISM